MRISHARLVGFLLFGVITVSCVVADDPAGSGEGRTTPFDGPTTVWSGETVVFRKADGADPTAAENQDRITDSVWITRGNSGGQIYNAAARSQATQSISPVGTLWAQGTTADLENLRFDSFRNAVLRPRSVVGRDLVMFIQEEGIFIDVRFLSWSNGKKGGFSYERSTPGE